MKEGGLWNEWKEQNGETVESIEHTRREGGQVVGIQGSNGRLLKEGCLWKEWKGQRGEIVESIEHTRMEGGDGVGVK